MRLFIYHLALLLIFTLNLNGQLSGDSRIIVLGTAQDGGYPHIGCLKECCTLAWENPEMKRYVVSLALTDPLSGKWYLFEATPDIKEQLQLFRSITGGLYNYLPDAIFVSHAHIGHYTGLAQFGREAMNTNMLTVYALARMKGFLEDNGPWSQLVDLNNIVVIPIAEGAGITLAEGLIVKPISVPHRDEFSETSGYRIETGSKKYLFIPDIDKWDKWKRDIVSMVEEVDVAFLDGTFSTIDELPGRNMNEIPHPFISETMDLFSSEPENIKEKIHFIHFNHSNPVLWTNASDKIGKAGFNVALQGASY